MRNRIVEGVRNIVASLTVVLMLFVMPASAASEAGTGLTVCNDSSQPASVALGFKGEQGWESKGWQAIAANTCAVVRADISGQRYIYLYANGEAGSEAWQGDVFLCAKLDEDFTIFGVSDCLARGYVRTGFFEVATGNAASWVVHLRSGGSDAAAPAEASASYQNAATPEAVARSRWTEVVVAVDAARPLAEVLAANGFGEAEAAALAEMLGGVRGPTALTPGARIGLLMGADGEGKLIPHRVSIYEPVDGSLKHTGTAFRGERGTYVLGLAPSGMAFLK